MRRVLLRAFFLFVMPLLVLVPAHAGIGDLKTHSGLPAITTAAKEADERRRLYQPPGWEGHGMRLDLGMHEAVLWDSNPQSRSSSQADGIASLVTSVDVRVRAGPDVWQLTTGGELEYVQPVSSSFGACYNAGAYTSLTGRAWDRSWMTGELSARRRYEMPGDPSRPRAAAEPVAVDIYRAEARALIRHVRAFSMVGGSVQRDDYHDGTMFDGSLLEQDDRDRYDMRTSYRAGFSPIDQLDLFVGEDRHYSINDMRQPYGMEFGFGEARRFIGIGMDINERLIAEITTGRASVHWLSPIFPSVNRSVRSASFVFAPTPLTTVSGLYEHMVREGAVYGWAGALSKEARFGISHEMLRNLEIGLRVSRQTSDWQAAPWLSWFGRERRDVLQSIEAEARFAFGPHWYLSLNVRDDDQASSLPEYSYQRLRLSTRVGVRL